MSSIGGSTFFESHSHDIPGYLKISLKFLLKIYGRCSVPVNTIYVYNPLTKYTTKIYVSLVKSK